MIELLRPRILGDVDVEIKMMLSSLVHFVALACAMIISTCIELS